MLQPRRPVVPPALLHHRQSTAQWQRLLPGEWPMVFVLLQQNKEQASKIRRSDDPGKPIFSVGKSNIFKRLVCRTTMIFRPSDSIYLKGKRSFRHGPHSNPKSAIVIVLATVPLGPVPKFKTEICPEWLVWNSHNHDSTKISCMVKC